MKTITLKIDNSIYEKFFWLLSHFSKHEIQVLEESDDIKSDLTIQKKPRVFGQHRGLCEISEDFNEELPDSFWLGSEP